jgi:hypothetical protein
MEKHVVNFGVDSLWINFCYADEQEQPIKREIDQEVLDRFAVFQDQARLQDEPVMTDLVFNGSHLWMYPHGGGARSPWRFLLRNDSIELKVGTGKKTGFVAKARFLASYLWSGERLIDCIAELHMFVCAYVFGVMMYPQVGEVHLCADVVHDFSMADWQDGFVRRSALVPHFDRQMHFVETEDTSDAEHVVGPDKVFMRHRPITGFSFGTHASAISAVIYNKSQYIRTKEPASDYFYTLWEKNGYDGKQDVWRVEFRLKRDVLRDFKVEGVCHGIDNAYELPDFLEGMWQYCTGQWMRYVVPDFTDTNRTRWQIQPIWQELQTAFVELVQVELGPVIRERKRVVNIERIVPQIVGCAMTYYAWLKNDTPCCDEDLSTALHHLYSSGLNYLERSHKDFNATVRKKQRVYGLIA